MFPALHPQVWPHGISSVESQMGSLSYVPLLFFTVSSLAKLIMTLLRRAGSAISTRAAPPWNFKLPTLTQMILELG